MGAQGFGAPQNYSNATRRSSTISAAIKQVGQIVRVRQALIPQPEHPLHSRPELLVHRRQADDIASTEGGQCAIERHDLSTVPPRQTEQVPVSYSFPVFDERSSGRTAGDTASGHQTYSRLATVSMSSRSALVSGDHSPPGNCAQTRITPSSVTAHVAHPPVAPSVANQSSASVWC